MDPKDAKKILRLQELLKRNEEYRRMRPKEFNRQSRCAKLEMAVGAKAQCQSPRARLRIPALSKYSTTSTPAQSPLR